MDERSREGGLKDSCDLVKWKTSVLECPTWRPNFIGRDKMIL